MTHSKPATGCWLDLPSAQVAEIIGEIGFDFVVVDLEHGPASVETAQLQMMALKASGTLAVVRVPESSEAWVKRVLDAGAGGVMVPRVESAAQAAEIVSWARYTPFGQRGEALRVVRASRWGRDIAGYRKAWQDKPFIAVQIESGKGLEMVREIAATPGVTQLFFGPADFAASIRLPMDDPAILAAASEVAAVAKEFGLHAGSVTFPEGTPKALALAGFTHISVTGDVAALVGSLDAALAAAQQQFGHAKG